MRFRGHCRDKRPKEKNIVLNQNEKVVHFWVVGILSHKKESEWTGRELSKVVDSPGISKWSPQIGL